MNREVPEMKMARATVKVKKGLYSAWMADEAEPELHPDTPSPPGAEKERLGKSIYRYGELMNSNCWLIHKIAKRADIRP